MNSWGYISVGLVCALIAGALFAMATPSELDIALAQIDGETAETSVGMQLVGYLFALGAAVLTPIGIVAEGVRVGNRQSATYSSMP